MGIVIDGIIFILLALLGSQIGRLFNSEPEYWPYRLTKNDLGEYFIQEDLGNEGYAYWVDVKKIKQPIRSYESVLGILIQLKKEHDHEISINKRHVITK